MHVAVIMYRLWMTCFGKHLRSSDVSDEAAGWKTGSETGWLVPCCRPALPHSWLVPTADTRGVCNTLHPVLDLSADGLVLCALLIPLRSKRRQSTAKAG